MTPSVCHPKERLLRINRVDLFKLKILRSVMREFHCVRVEPERPGSGLPAAIPAAVDSVGRQQ